MIETMVYECITSGPPGCTAPSHICWIIQQAVVKDKNRKPTGEVKTVFLPVYFTGSSPDDARNKAIAFWNDEKAKVAARKERGRKIGQSRKAAP